MCALQHPQQEPELPISLKPPSKLFYQSDAIRKYVLTAYWIVILLALPLWWKTTSIERLSLPTTRVHYLAEKHLQLPVNICIPQSGIPKKHELQDQLNIRTAQRPELWKGLNVNVSDISECALSDSSYSIISSGGERLVRKREIHFPVETGPLSELSDMISRLIMPYSNVAENEHRVAQYSSRYRLAFTLLNEDAAAGNPIISWDIRDAMNKFIYPITSRLSTLHNFTIESQVQFQAPLAFNPIFLDDSFGLTPEDLTVFVNSEVWTLSSSSSNDPVLHFILFIPSSERRPLKIMDADGTPSPSNAFLLPQWGGVVILDPSIVSVPSNLDWQTPLFDQTFSAFSNQLLALLGVPNLPAGLEKDISEEDNLITDWQLDAILRRRTLENEHGARDTLKSIVKLVDQIENMPVGEIVKGDVQGSLDALGEMYAISEITPLIAFYLSAKASSLASRAFYNPGMLALLYFPAEHKYAVYTPLFASALFPLLVAALREMIARRRRQAST